MVRERSCLLRGGYEYAAAVGNLIGVPKNHREMCQRQGFQSRIQHWYRLIMLFNCTISTKECSYGTGGIRISIHVLGTLTKFEEYDV